MAGKKGPAHPCFLVAVDERIISHYLSSLGIKPKRQFPQTKLPHDIADLFLVPFFAEKQKETTTTGSSDFAAQSPALARQRVRFVNEWIRNVRRDLFLGLPTLVQ